MIRRFPAFVLVAAMCAGVTLACPVNAQAPEHSPPSTEPLQPIQPPQNLPQAQRGDPAKNLDRLFAALKAAPTSDSAKFIEMRIWAIWAASGGDTATLLMSRVKTAMAAKDYDLSIKLLTAIIDIRPDYIEAWNRRATLYYLKKDFGASLADIRAVLAREPRHFGAWAGLGMIMQELGDDEIALKALRRALALHPHLERVPDIVKKLTDKVEGRNI
jgi:tetratricopeptide (TPR) repeat protein